MVMQVYVQTRNAEEPEVEQFYEDLQNLLELTTTTTTKDVFFIIGKWNAKVETQEKSLALKYKMKHGKG